MMYIQILDGPRRPAKNRNRQCSGKNTCTQVSADAEVPKPPFVTDFLKHSRGHIRKSNIVRLYQPRISVKNDTLEEPNPA